jgi:hypothetical protein
MLSLITVSVLEFHPKGGFTRVERSVEKEGASSVGSILFGLNQK